MKQMQRIYDAKEKKAFKKEKVKKYQKNKKEDGIMMIYRKH